MRTFLLHLRSTPLRWFLPALLVLDVALILTRDSYWHGLWGDTGATGQIPALYLGMFAAGAAAWTASLREQPEVLEPLSAMPRSQQRAELPRMLALVFIVLVPYLVGQAVAFCFTAPSWPPGFNLFIGYVLLGVAAVLLACGWGWLVGRLLPSRWGPLAGVFGWILVTIAFDTDLVVVSGPAREQPDLPLIAVRVAAAALLLGVCLWLPLGRDRMLRAALPGAAVVVALAATAGASGIDMIAPRHGTDDPLCVKGRTTVCLWPEEEKYQGMAERVLNRTEGLPPALAMPDKVYSLGLVRMGDRWVGDFDLDSGSEWALADGVTRAISAETFAACRRGGWEKYIKANDQSVLALERWLEKRLAGGGEPEYTESGMSESQAKAVEDGKSIADRPAEEQERWASDTVQTVLEKYCD
ncbi:hypothetical protein [Streptomyces sp. NPDC048340]|uniref:hypothetical protein n=1 Tax=Streptomyces sp. NPDC048340 TaxID=3365537 RepID=UPI003712D72E